MLQLPDQKDTIPPKLDDLLTKQEKKK